MTLPAIHHLRIQRLGGALQQFLQNPTPQLMHPFPQRHLGGLQIQHPSPQQSYHQPTYFLLDLAA